MSTIKKNQTNISAFKKLTDKILFKNAELFDPGTQLSGRKNIVIDNGVIDYIDDSEVGSFGGKIIDAGNLLLMPGLYDMHVHLREPGREDEETIKSGSLAAANGGFTGIACMPNTEPPIDTQETVQYIKEQAENLPVNVHPVATITKGRTGKELAPIAELVEAGAIAISDDGSPVMNAELMRRALEYSKMFDIPVLGHEEDINLSKSGHMHEGYYSTKLGIPGIPSISEEIMIARDIMLTEYAGGRFHVCHVSTKGSLELVRKAKEKGLNVTCEVAPHHFILTDSEVQSFDTNTKMNPPLRSGEDVQAMINGLKDGTIDVIATDHAPHAIEEKEAEFIYAPFGITGLETSLGLVLTNLVHKKIIDMNRMYDLMIKNPREILNLSVPGLKKGGRANLIVLDLNQKWSYKDSRTFSKSHNSPFINEQLTGRSRLVINNNMIFYGALDK